MKLFLKNYINIFLNDILLKSILGVIKNKVIIWVMILMLNNIILYILFIVYIV